MEVAAAMCGGRSVADGEDNHRGKAVKCISDTTSGARAGIVYARLAGGGRRHAWLLSAILRN